MRLSVNETKKVVLTNEPQPPQVLYKRTDFFFQDDAEIRFSEETVGLHAYHGVVKQAQRRCAMPHGRSIEE